MDGPGEPGERFDMVGRGGLALGVYLLTVNAATSPTHIADSLSLRQRRARWLPRSALLEYAGVAPVVQGAPRLQISGFLSRTGPGDRPVLVSDLASIYLAILFAFVSALFLVVDHAGDEDGPRFVRARDSRPGDRVVVHALRLITAASSPAVIGILRHRRHGFDAGVKALAGIAFVIAAQFFALVRPRCRDCGSPSKGPRDTL